MLTTRKREVGIYKRGMEAYTEKLRDAYREREKGGA